MKFLHFTDIHLTLPGETVSGRDPRRNFTAALDHAARHHPDAAFAAITGDLANWGEPKAYAFLAECAAQAPWPIHLTIGNHDDRARFLAAFPDHPVDAHGFVQYRVDGPAGPMLFLDTVEAGTHAGRLCERRLAWLDARLGALGRPALLFMHHHPLPSHVPSDDLIGLIDAHAFRAVVARHRAMIRHIFFGHCHLLMSGSLHGVPVSGLRGTNHQTWPDFAEPALLTGADLTPMYGVAFVEVDHVTVHAVDFSYSGSLPTMPTAYEAWAKPPAAPAS